jgi:hypothetical protein
VTNAYNNQFNNVPPRNGGIAVGMKVKTRYGIGTITEINYPTLGYNNVDTPLNFYKTITVVIPIPGKQPIVFKQNLNTVVFTSNVGGEATITAQYDNNL